MILSYNGRHPRIGENVFIAPTAVIIGDVEIADGASIWYGAVLRGDMEAIRIGAGSNLQDNSTVHTDRGHPAVIGAGVTVGHQAVVHGCTIADRCLIGIGALVLSGALIHEDAVVAAGAVVREGQIVAPGTLVAGVPAVAKRSLTEAERRLLRQPSATYAELARAHRAMIESRLRGGA
jgi:carbonic anhydrase/acetyltransferase-like protein (isoleucine patch superfamily)